MGAALLILLLCGASLTLGVDEGIYLEGARRIFEGQVPYRDFFVLTGPGTYWLLAGLSALLGQGLAQARLLLVADLAVMAALTCWLVPSRWALGASAAFLCLTVQATQRLYITHRWDSSAAILTALALVWAASSGERRSALLFLAGVVASAAAWITPTMALVSVALLLGLIAVKGWRSSWPYAAGLSAGLVVGASVLWVQGALGPMVQALWWGADRYAAANRVPYGALFAAPLPSGAPGLGVHSLWVSLLLYTAIPALLPPLAIIGSGWQLFRGSRPLTEPERALVPLLLLTAVALVASAYPRWSADQLLFVTPVWYVLVVWWAERTLRGTPRRMFVVACVLLAVVAFALAWNAVPTQRIHTQPGVVRGQPWDKAFLDALQRAVPPGERLFVFPYLPVLYVLTGTENPTRYPFLQPGMMTAEDEAQALADLHARPPRWVLYQNASAERILQVWPNSDRSRLRLQSIEDWIRAHYRSVARFEHPVGPFLLLRRMSE